MTVSMPNGQHYKLDISPEVDEPYTVKAVCSECRFTHKETLNNRICPTCFQKNWIPFTSIILSFYINLKVEQLIVAEISAFVVTYMKKNNIHLGINRQCPRSQMAIPAIPMEYCLDFLVNFDITIVGMPKSPLAPLAEMRLTQHKSFYLYLRVVVDKYPQECALVPFKITKLVLEYCDSSKPPIPENENLSFKDYSDFLLYFNDCFFSTSPELKSHSAGNVAKEKFQISNENNYGNAVAVNEAQLPKKRSRPMQVMLRKPRESRYIWQLGENLFLFREDQCSYCHSWIPTEWQKASHSFPSWEAVVKSLLHPDVDFSKVRMNDKIIAQLCADGELYVPKGINRPKLNHLNNSPAWSNHCSLCKVPK